LVTQAVENFSGLLSSPAVIDSVARQTGVSTKSLKDGLSTQQLGSSNVVTVSYVGRDRDLIDDILTSATATTLGLVQKSLLDPLEITVNEAQKNLEAAISAIQEFSQRTGYVVPDQNFRSENAHLIALQASLQRAQDEGRQGQAAALKAEIESRSSRLAQLVAEYQGLRAKQQLALGSLNSAEVSDVQVKGLLGATTQQTIAVTEPHAIPPLQGAGRTLTAVVAVALILALGLVAFFEFLLPSGRSEVARAADDASSEAARLEGGNATPCGVVPAGSGRIGFPVRPIGSTRDPKDA
jgi:hypothetical protein